MKYDRFEEKFLKLFFYGKVCIRIIVKLFITREKFYKISRLGGKKRMEKKKREKHFFKTYRSFLLREFRGTRRINSEYYVSTESILRP